MAPQIVFQGKKIQVAVERTVFADGTTGQRDIVLHPGAVVILPLVERERVCLVRNHRPAVGQTLLELPAGTLQPPESPESAAVRELAEETGYRAGRWRKLLEFYPSPGVLSEQMHLFVAQELTPGPMHLEADEQLVPELATWSDAVRWALDGTIRDAKTLVGLLLWDRLREDLMG